MPITPITTSSYNNLAFDDAAAGSTKVPPPVNSKSKADNPYSNYINVALPSVPAVGAGTGPYYDVQITSAPDAYESLNDGYVEPVGYEQPKPNNSTRVVNNFRNSLMPR